MSDDIRGQWTVQNAATPEGQNVIGRTEGFGTAVFGAPITWNLIALRVGNPLTTDDE